MTTKIATIPFAGFYETLHSVAIDEAFDRMFQDSEGDTYEALQDKAWIFADFSEAHKVYAKAYAEAFCQEFGIKGEYESMRSPKEYNFRTDTIYIELTEPEVKRLFDVVDKEILDSVCRENLTSRSGFISFYNPDYTEWGDVTEWDHNQLGQLMEAIAKQENSDFDQWAEIELTETIRNDGSIESALGLSSDRMGFQRLIRIADYLRQREERAYR